MTDAKPQELDPALIMRVARGLVRGLQAEEGWDAWRYTAELAIRSLGIPAAALNALVKGEAVVVPKEMTNDMRVAALNSHGTLTAWDRALAASPYRSEP